MWRQKNPPGYGETDRLDTPYSRVSAKYRRSCVALSDSQRTVSEDHVQEGDNTRRSSGHLVVYPKVSKEELSRRLKGKDHANETSRAAEKKARDLLQGQKI